MQVLKEEVKDRILTAAEKIFYEQDYRSAKLTDIAEQADIPVALIYTYFKNKEGLFDEVVAGVLDNIIKMMEDEEKMEAGSPYERFNRGGASQLPKLLKNGTFHTAFDLIKDVLNQKEYKVDDKRSKTTLSNIWLFIDKFILTVPALVHLILKSRGWFTQAWNDLLIVVQNLVN